MSKKAVSVATLALAALGGILAYRQVQQERAEQDLWSEATKDTEIDLR